MKASLQPVNLMPANDGVSKLKLKAFRSYEQLSLQCDARPVVLTGANGAGKTNILEAISLFSAGRGLRHATMAEIANANAADKAWAVSLSLSSAYGEAQIGLGMDPDALLRGRERRILKINGENVRSQTTLSEYIQVLWLTPSMDRLFMDTPLERRRFLDRLTYGLFPMHATHLKNYEQAMRQRLKLLKEGVNDELWLTALEAQMAGEGVKIANARRQAIEQLMLFIQEGCTSFPKAHLCLSGWIDEELADGVDLEDIDDQFKEMLVGNRRKDAIIGMTRAGPHRSDLACVYVEKAMPAAQCSTGEQKALLLSIVMAAARMQAHQTSSVLILLLDEVIAHLDPQRRCDLYDEIERLQIQTWMTGTDEKPFVELGGRAQYFCVENSSLSHKSVL